VRNILGLALNSKGFIVFTDDWRCASSILGTITFVLLSTSKVLDCECKRLYIVAHAA
jgi:hypothetical protein